MNIVRPDFLFSYWIFVWFIIYYTAITIDATSERLKLFREYGSPLLVLCIALIENLISIAVFIAYSIKKSTLLKYIIMIILAKGVPLYLLRNSEIKPVSDFLILSVVFGIYNFYLFLNKTNIFEAYHEVFQSIINQDERTPMFVFFRYIGRLFGTKF